MENTAQLIVAIATLIGTIGALVPSLIALFKFFKTNIKNKNWNVIMAFAREAVIAAEASGAAGADKKKMAMESVKKSCASADIIINEDELNNLSNAIDDLITWYNQMKNNK